MTIELLDATYEEVDRIKNLDEYKKLVELNELIKTELKDLIKDFNETKSLLEKETNKYSNNYKNLCNKLSTLHIKIENNELVKEYHRLEKEINKYLDNLRKEMLKAVRGEI
jgi:cell fate (sporulation/competence/biofilm development) regulator YlbF (YheA/YmcA/DUF963 family)